MSEIAEEAWDLALAVASGHPDSAKTSLALFPTNERKREASQKSFVTFAIGGVSREGRSVEADGPLFVWRAVAADINGDDIVMAPTKAGYILLERLDGLSLEQPHGRPYAEAFLNYLEEHAPGDFWGFKETVNAIGHGIDRSALVAHFSDARPDWSANVAATNSAGYVARCREWGLVKPEQRDRKYVLTEFGFDIRERET
jgi:hypothetical protein